MLEGVVRLAAHSFVRIGDEYFYSVRETYALECAAMFSDSDATIIAPNGGGVEFAVTAPLMIDRLEVLGYSLATAKHMTAEAYEEYADVGDPTLDDWARATVSHVDSPALRGSELPEWLVGVDPRWIVRAILDHCPSDSEIALDLTDVVERGFVAPTPTLCTDAFEQLHARQAFHGPLLVLTEGSNDAEFIGRSLQLLRPHVAEYVRFFDWERRPEGGAAALVRGVKAFAAAGVSNRIVAVFDSDAAATDALRSLDPVALPRNLRVVRLPELDLARSYPTQGPSGQADLDVNGLACSIEMYFGVDVLADEHGTRTPVKWTGYIQSLGRYQGEVHDKQMLHERFRRRLDRASNQGGILVGEDWSGMEAVIDTILKAFGPES